jgi:hypothetical protein
MTAKVTRQVEVEQNEGLRSANAVEVAPQRTPRRPSSAEEPVTSRILRKEQAGEWERRVSEGEERQTKRG